jgi:FAD/FMN-containing dehydrogenase
MTATGMSGATGVAAGLARQLDGRVIAPGDRGYGEARRVWNGCIDRSPALIACCESVADVAAAVRAAADYQLPLAVRGGGHGLPGFSTCDAGIVLDLSGLGGVQVDPGRRLARAGGGCLWSGYDAATHAAGLASPGGVVSTTGVAGLTLGGGVGWLLRKHGLACDNLLAADVVTADGAVVRASAGEHAELLWGLRGGGGNFGVVTSFEFRLHPVDTVIAGLMVFPLSRYAELAGVYRDWAAGLTEEFTTLLAAGTAPDEEFLPDDLRGQPAAFVIGCHLGGETAATADLAPLRAMTPAADLFGPMPYPELQSMFDADMPAGRRYYFKGGFLPALTDEAVATITGQMASRPPGYSEFHLHHMGGAFARTDPGSTAFPDRRSDFTYNILACWDDAVGDDTNRTWARGFAAALEPLGHATGYVNFLTDTQDATEIHRIYGSDRYARLQRLKRELDPSNLFALNQNIQPARS